MSHDNLKNLLIQLNGHDTNTVMGALDQLREYINNQNSVEGLFRIYSEEENYQVLYYLLLDFKQTLLNHDYYSIVFRLDLQRVLY